jgi:hypothetical protein
LDEETLDVIKSLKPPTPHDKPLKKSSIDEMFYHVCVKLQLDYDTLIDQKVRRKVLDVSFNSDDYIAYDMST